jgi:outer membrane immunogenic protein
VFDGADWKDTKEELPLFPGFFDEMKNPWFGSVTARLGYTVTPAVLLYVKGGGAWIRNELSVFHEGEFIGDANNTRTGWTIGGGLEWMFAPHWSVFLEYDHMDFGNHDATFTNPDGEHFNVFINNQKADIGLVGVNYRFWSGQPY